MFGRKVEQSLALGTYMCSGFLFMMALLNGYSYAVNGISVISSDLFLTILAGTVGITALFLAELSLKNNQFLRQQQANTAKVNEDNRSIITSK